MDPSTEKGYSAAWVAEKVLEAVQSGQQEVLLFTRLKLKAFPKYGPPPGGAPLHLS